MPRPSQKRARTGHPRLDWSLGGSPRCLLLGAEGLHGIGGCGAVCREPSRESGAGEQNEDGAEYSSGIQRLDVIQQATEEVGEAKRGDQTNCDTGGGKH